MRGGFRSPSELANRGLCMDRQRGDLTLDLLACRGP
jgi:hypothetical protein